MAANTTHRSILIKIIFFISQSWAAPALLGTTVLCLLPLPLTSAIRPLLPSLLHTAGLLPTCLPSPSSPGEGHSLRQPLSRHPLDQRAGPQVPKNVFNVCFLI